MTGLGGKEWLGLVSVAVALIAYLPYIGAALAGKIKPHAFSWIIWTLITAISFTAQWTGDAGPGSWATAATTVFCALISVLALVKGEKNITRGDWISFIAALMAIPLWHFTKEPLYAVILITLIDALGFYPSFRKAWLRPWEEMYFTFLLSSVKFGFAVMAIEDYSLVTALHPSSLVFTNFAFVLMLFWRRHGPAPKTAPKTL